MIDGIDFSSGHGITAAEIKHAGYGFAGRYLTGLDGNPKDMGARELEGYLAAGLAVVLVFERDGQEFTEAEGITHANAAQAQLDQLAAELNLPDLKHAPVFFAQDLPEAAGVDPVAYMRGVNSVIGVARSGLYGRYWTVKKCFDAGVIRYGWQTSGQSGGVWDNRALIRQDRYGVPVGPAICDINQAAYWNSPKILTAADDYGQFPRPVPPFTGPYRHVASGQQSLADVAAERGTTVDHIVAVTIRAQVKRILHPEANGATAELEAFASYIDRESFDLSDAPMPEGLVWYSDNA